MRTIYEQELKIILDKHGKFLRSEEGGERADLRYADLSSADLSYADLSYANLRYANLSYANLSSADLSYADLRYADLSSADLSYANLVVFQFQRHWAYFTFDGFLRIGCHHLPISEWELGYKELGKADNYSDEQILMYGNFIKSCIELLKMQEPKQTAQQEGENG